MLMGPEDLVAFAFSYLPMLACWAVATLGVCLAFIFARRRNKRPSRWKLVAPIILASIVGWIIYFAATAEWKWTIAMLGSEDDQFAESVYKTSFRGTTLRQALRLATDASEEQNARFYAACLVADRLVTNNEQVINGVLSKVENAPALNPGFFGTNDLNSKFMPANRPPWGLSVKDVIVRRLEELRKEKLANGRVAADP
jgi:hypothetical protein